MSPTNAHYQDLSKNVSQHTFHSDEAYYIEDKEFIGSPWGSDVFD
jgi:hypothetical protein